MRSFSRRIGNLVVKQSKYDELRQDFYYDGRCGKRYQTNITCYKPLRGMTDLMPYVIEPRCVHYDIKRNMYRHQVQPGNEPECIECLSGMNEALFTYVKKVSAGGANTESLQKEGPEETHPS